MYVARAGYRRPPVEALLLFSAAFQGLSGLWLVVARWKQRRGYVAWLQAASGSYLALFLLIHVGAVIMAAQPLASTRISTLQPPASTCHQFSTSSCRTIFWLLWHCSRTWDASATGTFNIKSAGAAWRLRG